MLAPNIIGVPVRRGKAIFFVGIAMLFIHYELIAQIQKLAWMSGSIPEIEEVAWSPAGDKIASAGWDGVVRIWSNTDGTQLATFQGHMVSLPVITSVRWNHNGDRIASGTSREVIIWDANDGAILHRISTGRSWIFSLRWNLNDSLLAYESDGEIYILNSWTGQIDTSFRLNVQNGYGVKAGVSWVNGNIVMAGSQNGGLKIFNINSRSVAWSERLITTNYGFYDIALSPNGRTIGLASYQYVYLFDLDTYRITDSIRASQDYLWTAAWSTDGLYLAATGNWNTPRIYDMRTKSIAGHIPFPADTEQTANRSLMWSPDGKQIALGSNLKDNTGRVSVWNLDQQFTEVSFSTTTEKLLAFSLSQNYPNPFNPNTTIRFSLPKTTYVTLNIFNTLGQVVTQLVSQYMSAGTYTTEWNASGFASAVYYYRLEAGSFIETKKLILLR
jgi:WD40 repeat protein